MHSNEAIQNYNDALDQSDLPKKWDYELHTVDIDSEDLGLINFADTKGFLSKVTFFIKIIKMNYQLFIIYLC